MKKVFIALGLMVVGSLLSVPTFAASRDLGVTPLRTQITVDPGTSYNGSLSLSNDTSHAVSIDLYAQIFTVTKLTYDYVFNESSPVNEWVHFSPSSLQLPANSTQKITYTLGVPTTATPGSKYFSLFAATTDHSNSGSIATAERVGSLLYVTVPGNPSHKGELLGLNVPTVAFSTISWSEEVNNTGANYFTSAYTVSLVTPWNSTVSSQKGSATILSSSIRLMNGQLSPPRWLGIYKVSASFSLGDNGTQTHSRWLLYIPFAQGLVLLVIIAAVVLLVVTRHRKKTD